MPDEQSQMNHYMKKTTLQDGQALRRPDPAGAALPRKPDDESRRHEIRLDPPQRIEPPDDYFFPAGILTSLRVHRYRPCKAVRSQGTRSSTRRRSCSRPCYTNVITGETSRFALDQLPLGVKRVSAGCFYFISHPLMYYDCAAIQDNMVLRHLIESFPDGEKVTGTMRQDIKYSPHYIPVTDKKIISRLERRLDEFLKSRRAEGG